MADSPAVVRPEVLERWERHVAETADRLATAGADAGDQLRALIEFQVERALKGPPAQGASEVELCGLEPQEAAQLRWLIRRHVAMWSSVLVRLHPLDDEGTCLVRAQAVLGLIASARHRVGDNQHAPEAPMLTEMAWAAATAD